MDPEGVPLSVRGEFKLIDAGNRLYFGYTESLGLGSYGAEAHAEWGETATFCQFNVYDVAKGIYVKIKEW